MTCNFRFARVMPTYISLRFLATRGFVIVLRLNVQSHRVRQDAFVDALR